MIKKKISIENKISFKLYGNTKKFSNNYNRVFKEILSNIDNSQNTYNLFSDTFKLNFNASKLKFFKKFKEIVIIGMGGSVLGSEAIYNFLRKKIKKNLFFLNNMDADKLIKLKKKNLKKVLFLTISKSGNTLETISNLLALNIIRKNAKNIIIISEKKNNFLYFLSQKFNLLFVEHKEFIGGRYSVLSEVGIVPAFLMGLKIKYFRHDLKKYFKKSNNKILKESAIKLASLLLKGKYTNLIFLNYSSQLEKFLYWLQQLIAESLGKDGKGFLPTISNNPKDHHSLLQLYLDGPKDKIFYIFSVEEKYDLKLKTNVLRNNLKYLNNKNLNFIKSAQRLALIQSLKIKKIPFREIKIREDDEESLVELFSYFILETSIIGKLIGVNPFDQPAVEQVKNSTNKILK